MKRAAWAIAFCLATLAPARAEAILLEDTPERQLFLGYPADDRTLTVKIVRRKQSYGLYLFRTENVIGRQLSREAFLGLVEGSKGEVTLDPRSIAFLRAWLERHGRDHPPPPMHLGPYVRYTFADPEQVLSVTLKRPYLPTEAYPMPLGIVSQLYGKREVIDRLEQLSRVIDAEAFSLKDLSGLRRIGR